MISVHHTDCLAWLADYASAREGVPDNHPLFDACVTDPPYHLTSIVKRFGKPGSAEAKVGATGAYARASRGFMGKEWDGGDIAFRPETWRAVFDVLKPGAHLVAFSGTRTYHRMAVAIEDAGFEIRDQIAWVFGAGFPKSHQVNRNPMFCQCGEAERNGASIGPSHTNAAHTGKADALQDDALRPKDVRCSTHKAQDFPGDCQPDRDLGDEQPRRAEARGQVRAPSPQCAPEHSHSSASGDGPGHGSSDTPSPAQYRSRPASKDCPPHVGEGGEGGDIPASRKSRADKCGTQPRTPDIEESLPSQTYATGFPDCQICGKPVADGFGTALKPAWECICLARKPLSKKSVAANVLRHGTGAINVDGCRVGTTGARNNGRKVDSEIYGKLGPFEKREYNCGRWPANLAHDGSEEVLAGFPETDSGGGPAIGTARSQQSTYGKPNENRSAPLGSNSGSAARFFYSAKAGPLDRIGTAHATVKPVDLIRWLARLITPPGGHILDPFAGSGTTGIAALAEGFDCTMLELEAAHFADIERKLAFLRGEGGVSAMELHKARIERQMNDDGPLFAGAA